MWSMIVAVILLQAAVIFLPLLQNLFYTQPLGLMDLLLILGVNALILVIAEALKLGGKSV
ncbi:MAG: hypothetical protein CVV27_01590 [Candidatus Melainabacteria bacterium HGW-Melainabacteria-1]|nr:MAG: hypothetical protein CVV27_01590 [Candidatus Melainabacteria bacterium HGW-Melainabacteria-1]